MLYSDKLVVFRQKWLNSGKGGCFLAKVVVFGETGCVRAKMVLLGQKWLYSGKSGCIRERSLARVKKV